MVLTPTAAPRSRFSALVATTVLALGCVHGPSAEDIERAQRQVDLAVALHGEGNRPAATAQLRDALDLDPENPEAHVLLAVIQFERGDYPQAEEHGRRGVEFFVEHQARGARVAEARNILGSILIAANKAAEAVPILEESAHDEMNTAPHLAYGNLGLALLHSGQIPEAIEALRTSVRLQRRFCLGYMRLGMAYVEQEEWADAEEALSLAVTADESCGEAVPLQAAWRLRAEARAHLGRRDDAMADLDRCVTLSAETSEGELCHQLLEVAQGGGQ